MTDDEPTPVQEHGPHGFAVRIASMDKLARWELTRIDVDVVTVMSGAAPTFICTVQAWIIPLAKMPNVTHVFRFTFGPESTTAVLVLGAFLPSDAAAVDILRSMVIGVLEGHLVLPFVQTDMTIAQQQAWLDAMKVASSVHKQRAQR